VPAYARIIRATVLSIKDQEYIEAATCIGSSRIRTLFRHVIPNCFAPIIVQMSMSVSTAILSASSLSFIGLGITPPLPEWGAMLSNGRPYIRDYTWLVTFPGMAIMVVILALNIMGDGLRDALDPRLKR
jgi:peptide/nickel transport system permease protein